MDEIISLISEHAERDHFWARYYYVSTVGRDETTIREYIKQQEQEDRRLDQLSMFEE